MKRVYLSRRDGMHVFAFGWHFHGFVWTRGRRRNPVYVRLERLWS